MKTTLTTIATLLILTGPAFAEPSVKVVVPVEPTNEEVVQAKADIMEASKQVCRKAYATGYTPFHKANVESCIELTYERTLEEAAENNMAAWSEDTASTQQ